MPARPREHSRVTCETFFKLESEPTQVVVRVARELLAQTALRKKQQG